MASEYSTSFTTGTTDPTLPFEHAVVLYRDTNFLVNTICGWVATSLQQGGTAFVLATAEHRRLVARRLAHCHIDISTAQSEGRYHEIDAEQVLAECVVDETFDPQKLSALVGQPVAAASHAANPRTMVYGELVALLWARRDFLNLRSVELWWEAMGARVPFSLLCGYPIDEFSQAGTEESLLRICDLHASVIPPDEYPSPAVERRILEATARWYTRPQMMA